MALTKDVTLDNGVTVNYWKIVELQYNSVQKTINVLVNGWVSEEYREKNAPAISTFIYFINDVDPTVFNENDALSYVYGKLKTNEVKSDMGIGPDLTGAVDA